MSPYPDHHLGPPEWNTETQGVSATAALHNGGQGAALMSAAWIALQNVGVQPVADLSAQPPDEQAFTPDPEVGVVDFDDAEHLHRFLCPRHDNHPYRPPGEKRPG